MWESVNIIIIDNYLLNNFEIIVSVYIIHTLTHIHTYTYTHMHTHIHTHKHTLTYTYNVHCKQVLHMYYIRTYP